MIPVTETIEQFIRSGDAMIFDCGACHHSQPIDMEKLKASLGPNHGALFPDLKDVLRCPKCKSRHFSFSRQAKGNEKRNSYAKAKGI